jgi:hypothetical protein
MIAALFLSTALAGVGLSAEVGVAPTRGDGHAQFSSASTLPMFGGRASIDLTPGVALQVAAHHGRHGAWLYDDDGRTVAETALYATDATLGLQGALPVGDYLRFTATAAALGHLALARLDSGDDRDDPVKVARWGIAPGFRAAGGVEIRIEESALPVPITLHLEVGAEHTTRAPLGEIGAVRFSGPSGRLGLGLRF